MTLKMKRPKKHTTYICDLQTMISIKKNKNKICSCSLNEWLFKKVRHMIQRII